jgi:small subunit ribosomal protein S20
VEAGNKEQATVLAREATKALDKAASKGVIHANQAANRKSSISKKASAL